MGKLILKDGETRSSMPSRGTAHSELRTAKLRTAKVFPPAVTVALGLKPGATEQAHRIAALGLRVGAELAQARAQRFATAAGWLEETLGIGREISAILAEIAEALHLPANATQADMVERLKDLFEYGSPIEVQHAARTLFLAQVNELRKAEPDVSVGDAQARVAKQRPQLFAAAYAVSRGTR